MVQASVSSSCFQVNSEMTEAPIVYTNPNVVVQPVVTYDPATGSPLGEGETEVVTVTNDYSGVNLLGMAINITPKFTG